MSDDAPLRAAALLAAVVLAIVLIADGFDILILAYVAPAVTHEFGLTRQGLGFVLTASIVGVALGGMIGGYLGDRLGRRTVIVGSLILFGLMTTISALSTDPVPFSAARLIAGLGLGAATPNAAALMEEILPRAWRSQIIMIAYASSTIGTTGAALAVKHILPSWGWRGVFYAGAALPFVATLLVLLFVPESLQYLAARRDRDDAVSRQGGRLADLASPAFRRDTLALAGMIFSVLFAWSSLGNWGTTIITTLGRSLTSAADIMMAFNLAGLACSLSVAFLIRRIGSRPILLTLAAVMIVDGIVTSSALRFGFASPALIVTTLLIAGGSLTALLQGAYPVATQAFPTSIRALGVGVAFGFGRLGAVSSSLVAAVLLDHGGPPTFFLGVTIAALVALACIATLQRHIPRNAPSRWAYART